MGYPLATPSDTPPIPILFITSGLRMGGAEIFLLRLLEQLDRKRYAPSVLSMLDEGQIGPEITRLGIELKVLEIQKPHRFFRNLPKLLAWVWTLKPKIIQGWMYHGNLLSAFLAPFTGSRLFFSIHCAIHKNQGEKSLTAAVVWMNARLSRRAEGIVYCSKSTAKEHEAVGFMPQKTIIIPSGFDCGLFCADASDRTAIRDELSIREEAFVVGMFGRFHPVKDFPALIEAFSKVHAQYPKTRLLLAGDGVDASNSTLNTWLENAGISEVTLRLGIRSDMPRLYRALDLLAMTSISEVGPLVVGEAMASQVPCLATDVGMAREMIRDAGWIVDVGDIDQIRKALLEALEMTPMAGAQMGIKAREIIQKHWSIAEMSQSFLIVYQETA